MSGVVKTDLAKPRDESSSPGSPCVPPCKPEQWTLTLSRSLTRWQNEARHGRFDTGRYRCRFYTWGRGPALVFIPGLSLESTSFVMAMAQLQTEFCCAGYELPVGSGDGASLAAYRHRYLRDDLFALLDHLHLDRAYLLGFSFGSTIALAALAGQPRRFPRAILLGGFARRPLALSEVMLAHWLRYCPGRIANLPMAEGLIRRHNADLFASRPANELDVFCVAECEPLLRAWAARALLMHHTDLRPLLARIRQPALLVYGDRDRLVGRKYQDELKAGLCNSARAEIEHCGHYPQLTHPEVFTEIIRQFLTPAATSQCAR